MKKPGDRIGFKRGGAVLTGTVVRVRRATYFVRDDSPLSGRVFVVPAREAMALPREPAHG